MTAVLTGRPARRRARALVAALAACTLLPAGAAAASPTKLAASIIAAARGSRSVHYVSSSTDGRVQVTQIADVGTRAGIQKNTFRQGGRTGHVTVLVSTNGAYLRADSAFTLVTFLGFAPGPAGKYAGRWILIAPSDADYATVAAAVTLSSAVDELELAGPISRLPDTTRGGQRLTGVAGTSSGTGRSVVARLYARKAGLPLPVSEVIDQRALRSTITFSRWNEPVAPAVPAHAIPIAKTGLEQPPAGVITA